LVDKNSILPTSARSTVHRIFLLYTICCKPFKKTLLPRSRNKRYTYILLALIVQLVICVIIHFERLEQISVPTPIDSPLKSENLLRKRYPNSGCWKFVDTHLSVTEALYTLVNQVSDWHSACATVIRRLYRILRLERDKESNQQVKYNLPTSFLVIR
jgi:hypothetical protein